MNIQTLIVTALFAASGPLAHAADFDPPMSAQAQAGVGKTRAEVKAETLRALKAGEISTGDVGYPPAFPSGNSRSRADVKAETRQALAAGDITFGDATYPKFATAAGAGPTRAEVKGELMRAIAARELHFSDTAYPDSGLYTTPRTKVRVQKAGPVQAATTTATPTT